MLSEKQCEKLVDVALTHGADRTDGMEVHVSATNVATSRFANNGMTQNQAPNTVNVSVRAIVDGRQARLSTDQSSPKAVRNLVDNVVQAAKLLDRDPDLLPVFTPGDSRQATTVNRYNARTARISPDDRAAAIRKIVAVGKEAGHDASGVFASGSRVTAIGNSNGLFLFHRESEAECSVTMTGADSSGWAKAHSTNVRDIDPEVLARRASDKALASASPVAVDPGHYTVILEPSAALDLVGFLWYDFAGTSHNDRLSCFLDKVGQKVLGDNVTIVDDVGHPLTSGAPFDGEGVGRQKITLVENGVIKDLVYGRRSARKAGAAPTGHGLAEPNTMGEYPVNLVFSGGDSSLEEMIRSTDRGILLTRVWYVRDVDPTRKIVTGMTRDGTFLVEDGAIKCGVKNMRFNVSLVEMLNKVLALGQAQRTAGEEAFPAVVPAMKVDNFYFSSVTRF